MPKAPVVLALAGGPLGGKSTTEQAIQEEFGPKGRVYFVDEAATVLLGDALFPRPVDFSGEAKREWLFHFQIAVAGAIAMVEHAAQKFAQVHSEIELIVCDRGLPDMWAYIEDDDHQAVENILGCSLTRALSRYTGDRSLP